MRISDWSSDVCSSDLGEDRKQRLDQSHHVGVVAGELVDPGGKDLAPRRAELEAGFAQRRPHHVLERAHLVQNRTPRHQERSPLPALSALNVNLQIGRASCRDRGCQYVWMSVDAVYLKKIKCR